MELIVNIAKKIGLNLSDLNLYGNYIAKINESVYEQTSLKNDGKLILVSAINPTPAGEGKTTISIGLLDAFFKLHKKAILSLREPSMGPLFGMKGGATGGGVASVVPVEEINLHFTGDLHAVASANNLLAALVDDHIFHGNDLKINPKTIKIKRCVDVNDRVLRDVVVGLGSKMNGFTRQTGFTITAASEFMAILCLATNLHDLKKRIENILIGFSFDGKPVFVSDLQIQNALVVVLKNALQPNLVQTINGSPVLIHGGPFANIAHGCCSVKSTKLALKLADYTITEAGFGADLGAEKFFNIKSRVAKLQPNCVVLVVSIRALKFHGGSNLNELGVKNLVNLEKGLVNLKKHIDNVRLFGVEVIVAINKFESDFNEEINLVEVFCNNYDCLYSVCDVYKLGGDGAIDLAEKIALICEKPSKFKLLYDDDLLLTQKIEKICKEIYGAGEIVYPKNVISKLNSYELLGFGNLPICVCKTPYSLSTNSELIGCPHGFTVEVVDVDVASGAGFIIVLTNNVVTMPGYGKNPIATSVDLNGEWLK